MTGNRIWIVVTVFAIAAILGLGWLLGASPKLAEADLALEQQRSVETQNLIHEATLVNLREQFENIDEIEGELAELREEIPEAPELEAFIDSVNATAVETGVAIVRIAAAEAVTFGGAAEGETVVGSESFMIHMTIDVVGPPAAVVAFSERLQLGTRVFFVPTFSFDAVAGTGMVTGYLYVLPDPRDAESADEATEEAEADDATEGEAP